MAGRRAVSRLTPSGRLERLGRWLRQHRTWTFAAAACADRHFPGRHRWPPTLIEGARRRRESPARRPRANFNMALKAVEDYLTSVSENTLLKQQDSVDIRSLRQELLNTALKYYKSFVNQRNDDPKLRQQLANAYFRVGEITQEIDSRDRGDRGVSLGADHLGSARRGRPENPAVSRPPGRLPPGDRQAEEAHSATSRGR